MRSGIKKTQKVWAKWNEATEEEEKQQGMKAISPVYRCYEVTTTRMHAVLQQAPSDLRGGPFRQHQRVLVATLFSRKPHRQVNVSSMPPCTRSLEVHHYCSECCQPQRTRRHDTELSRSSSNLRCLFVLKCPALAMSNVGTATEFLADGLLTDSVTVS